MLARTQGTARRRFSALLPYVALVALSYVLGLASVTLTSGGTAVSAWWPAAGVAVLAVLAVPRRHRGWATAGLCLMTGLSNYLAGRPVGLSVAYGIANSVEALTVAWLLTSGGRRATLDTLADVRRLLTATVAGAAVVAAVAGVAAALLTDGAVESTAFAIFASHGSAVVTIVPLGIAGNGYRSSAMRWQRFAQPAVLTAVTFFVFAPGNHKPLAFLPMPFLVWGAFQFSTRQVAIQLAAFAFTVTTLTQLGGGPFAGSGGLTRIEEVEVLQSFLVTYAASTLVFSAARNERLRLAARLAEREQLLRGGILDAQVGLVIMQETAGGTVQIIQSNERAADLLGPTIPLVDTQLDGTDGPLLDVESAASPLFHAIRSARTAPDGEWYDEFAVGEDGSRHVELFLTRVPQSRDEALLTVQAVDVTERHRADDAVRRALTDERRAAEHLRDLNRQKDDFVAAVSHELRTPITSILGFVEVLTDEGELTPEQVEHLGIVERNARRLSVLVEDLLTLGSRANRAADPTSSTAMRHLCAECVTELTPYADDHGVALTLATSPETRARVDRGDATRVMSNLVTNAVKFTPAGGSVTVALNEEDGQCVLSVTDTGSGIAPDALEKVFDRFYRTAEAEEASVPGAGLGLALVRELVERHGGSVALQSDGISGTRAVVRLPLVPEVAAVASRHRQRPDEKLGRAVPAGWARPGDPTYPATE